MPCRVVSIDNDYNNAVVWPIILLVLLPRISFLTTQRWQHLLHTRFLTSFCAESDWNPWSSSQQLYWRAVQFCSKQAPVTFQQCFFALVGRWSSDRLSNISWSKQFNHHVHVYHLFLCATVWDICGFIPPYNLSECYKVMSPTIFHPFLT